MHENRTAVRWRIAAEYDWLEQAKYGASVLASSAPLRITVQALDAHGVALWTEDGDPRHAVRIPKSSPQESPTT